MTEPLLNLDNIRLMGQRIGGGRGAQRMDAKAIHFGDDTSFKAVLQDDFAIDRGRIERPVEIASEILLGPYLGRDSQTRPPLATRATLS
jgi:hypothetical protein